MKSRILSLQGVSILSRDKLKKVTGGGSCGVKIGGSWWHMTDINGDGYTQDDAYGALGGIGTVYDAFGNYVTSGEVTNWCCDSCEWN